MDGDVRRSAVAAGLMSIVGVSQSGPAGLAFLIEPVPVPLWFVLAAVALPTGELLAAGRSVIYKRTGASDPTD